MTERETTLTRKPTTRKNKAATRRAGDRRAVQTESLIHEKKGILTQRKATGHDVIWHRSHPRDADHSAGHWLKWPRSGAAST